MSLVTTSAHWRNLSLPIGCVTHYLLSNHSFLLHLLGSAETIISWAKTPICGPITLISLYISCYHCIHRWARGGVRVRIPHLNLWIYTPPIGQKYTPPLWLSSHPTRNFSQICRPTYAIFLGSRQMETNSFKQFRLWRALGNILQFNKLENRQWNVQVQGQNMVGRLSAHVSLTSEQSLPSAILCLWQSSAFSNPCLP